MLGLIIVMIWMLREMHAPMWCYVVVIVFGAISMAVRSIECKK